MCIMDYTSIPSISGMCRVWSHVSSCLRSAKEQLCRAQDTFYGKEEPIIYLANVQEALKIVTDRGKSTPRMCTLQDIENRIEDVNIARHRSESIIDAKEVVFDFINKVKVSTVELLEIKDNFKSEVVQPLTKHCSDYRTLGIADDEFYKTLRARTHHIKDIMLEFEKMKTLVDQNCTINTELFCDDKLSQEIAIEFNCDTFQILRIVPDLIQKLESIFNISHDWLRSDRVYIGEVQQQIEKTKDKIKCVENIRYLAKLEYEKTFVQLKQKQTEYDSFEDTPESIKREIAKLDARKTRLEMEISAVSRTLKSCRENLRDLISSEGRENIDDLCDNETTDEVDGEAMISDRPRHAQSTYRSRVCRDARAHAAKLQYLHRKLKKISKRISHCNMINSRIQALEQKLQDLSKRLRTLGKKKSKLLEKEKKLAAHLEILEDVLRSRRTAPSPVEDVKQQQHNQQKSPRKYEPKDETDGNDESACQPKSETHTLGLHRAFNVVKTHIGLGWRDLARNLPYRPAKELDEINSEICEIEYANRGQLKEQAYQSLLKWYNHCGRRASLEDLEETLRELNENNIADKIENVKEESIRES